MTDTTTQGKLTSEQLTKNAGIINAAHEDIVQANKTSIEKAIEAGTVLKACKDTVGHGVWSKWLHDNCPDISEETARLYIRLAAPENAWKLEAEAKQNGNTVADLTIRAAAKSIRAPLLNSPQFSVVLLAPKQFPSFAYQSQLLRYRLITEFCRISHEHPSTNARKRRVGDK
jgi:hypothetical protein